MNGHEPECQQFPTGWLCVAGCETVWRDKAATGDTDLRDRADTAFLVGVNYARADERERIAQAIQELTRAGDLTDEAWDNGYRCGVRDAARVARDGGQP